MKFLKKYGLRQTIADTLGIGGIFPFASHHSGYVGFRQGYRRGLSGRPVFLNYTNPMATLTGAMLRYTNVKTVGLCHSVQVCSEHLFKSLGMDHEGVEEKNRRY
ncbi:hypothetical protein GCM10020331_096460 [Ectobacillus funiculus]